MTTPTPDNAASAPESLSWLQQRELIRAALCKELDTDIEDSESTYTIVMRAANALHWRQKELEEWRSKANDHAATVTALEAEVRELRADAMRYRWVKDRSLNKTVMDSRQQNGPFFAYGSILSGWHTPNDIDGAIDAHMTGAGAK